ncbi:winged helix-turn-helix domain-containing protein [Rosenbergiella epipactidis]|uniref:winged helix-turn-helix domain-containing protein n=1 Tax=Rosenbergiella epipactidis TaxID=1544694 RepID=UPI001F4F1DFA|nr:winged helix-turn-helix domain-containing protein [Rosenbergiella epipactidis]
MSKVVTINGFLRFEPDKKKITGREISVAISSSASLCLELLIDHVGELVTHQQFYDYVWRRFGTEPGSTNLYQSISALRHALHKTGIQENIIRTMPRKGFLLSPLVVIKKSSGSQITERYISSDKNINSFDGEVILGKEKNEMLDVCLPKEGGESSVDISFFKNFLGNRHPLQFVLFIYFMILSFFLFLFFLFHGDLNSSDYRGGFYNIGNRNGCFLFSSVDNPTKGFDILKATRDLNFNCKETSYVYIFFKKGSDRLSYFSCQEPIDGKSRLWCHSFYYIKNFNDD